MLKITRTCRFSLTSISPSINCMQEKPKTCLLLFLKDIAKSFYMIKTVTDYIKHVKKLQNLFRVRKNINKNRLLAYEQLISHVIEK